MQSTEAVFDPALIVRVSRGDRDKERRLLGDFLRLNAADMAQLQQAVQSGDHGQAQGLAHRMRGAAQTLGAHAFGHACRLLEDAARAGPHGAMQAAWTEVERQSARLEEAVRRYLG